MTTEPITGNNSVNNAAPIPGIRPRTAERAEERQQMVEKQIAARGVRDPRVLDALRDVPRHWFVTPVFSARAYDDGPLPIGYDQTISQPYIVAMMTQMLEIQPGEKVLEIGTGSGYQAAVLWEFTDQVYTIEIVADLALRTMTLFSDRGYGGIHARTGDGYQGWLDAAPFDVVIVTCAAERPPSPLVEQLAIGGRMCIPLNEPNGSQRLTMLRKAKDGTIQKTAQEWVRFVPMTGEAELDRLRGED